jgi:hypothetical protein
MGTAPWEWPAWVLPLCSGVQPLRSWNSGITIVKHGAAPQFGSTVEVNLEAQGEIA